MKKGLIGLFMIIFAMSFSIAFSAEINVEPVGTALPEPRIYPERNDVTNELDFIDYFVQSTGATSGIRYRTPTIYITAENADGTIATVSIPATFPPIPPGETRVFAIRIDRAEMEAAGFRSETFRELERISIGADLEVYNVNNGKVLRTIKNAPINEVYKQLEELQMQFGFSRAHIEDMKTYWIGSLLDVAPVYIDQYKYSGQISEPLFWQIGVPKGDTHLIRSHGYYFQWGLSLIDGMYKGLLQAPAGFFWEYNCETAEGEPPSAIAKDAVAWRHLDRWEVTFHNNGEEGVRIELKANQPLHYRLYRNYRYDPVTGEQTGDKKTRQLLETGVLQPGEIVQRSDIQFNGAYDFMPLTPTMVSGAWGDLEVLAQNWSQKTDTSMRFYDEVPEEMRELAEELVLEFQNSK